MPLRHDLGASHAIGTIPGGSATHRLGYPRNHGVGDILDEDEVTRLFSIAVDGDGVFVDRWDDERGHNACVITTGQAGTVDVEVSQHDGFEAVEIVADACIVTGSQLLDIVG